MTKYEIIEDIARRRQVEETVSNIAHSPLTADLQDLAQMVYVILLEYDDDKIADLWENNQIGFFIARIVLNQFRSKHSPWHDLIRKPQMMNIGIESADVNPRSLHESKNKKLHAVEHLIEL